MDVRSGRRGTRARNEVHGEIVERGGRVKLTAIKEPQFGMEDPLRRQARTFAHEQHITKRINT